MTINRSCKLPLPIALLALAISPAAHALDDLDVTIRVIDRLDRNAEAFINRIELPAQSTAGAAAMSPREEGGDRGDRGQREGRPDPAADSGRDSARERAAEMAPPDGERRERGDAIAETAREAGERRREAIEDARQQRREALEEMRESRGQRGN